MKKLRLVSFCALAISLLAISCSKKGDTGPAGPPGPAGPDSVSYSAWTALNLVYNTTDSLFEQTIAAPAITQAVLDKGIILSYVEFTDQGGNTNVFNASELVYVTYSVGSISIASLNGYTGLQFRYVIVPGTVSLNSIKPMYKGYSQADLEKMGYQAAMGTLGIRPN